MALSDRAQAMADQASQMSMWDIIPDLWHPSTNPDGFISLGVAENALMHAELASHIQSKFAFTSLSHHTALTYGDGSRGSKALRSAMARFLTRHLSPIVPFEAEHVAVTSGVTTAIEHISWTFMNPGEGILLGRPFYRSFIEDIKTRPGAEVVQVAFGEVDPFSLAAVTKYEEAIVHRREKGQKVAALMLCHPHNPLGRCYPKETIEALMRLCQKYKIHFVSDEIYALSVWKPESGLESETPFSENDENDEHEVEGVKRNQRTEPVEFVSASAIAKPEIIDLELVHLLWGLSKDFGANGLRMGCIISQSNANLHQALKLLCTTSYPSSVTDHVVTNLLSDDDFVEGYYLPENRRRLASNHAFITAFFRKRGIRYYDQGVNAAFFTWADLGGYRRKTVGRRDVERRDVGPCGVESTTTTTTTTTTTDGASKAESDAQIAQLFLRNKVYIPAGLSYGAEEPGWFRIVFSHPRDVLEEGLKRMMDVLDS